ncbi:MAG: TusE/DsrC/DsvC family sulfur relay protein, partial [Halieaceae bacterium]|nr:TusE/DsrC/DsvC family sulfur relay protein [Halieaceae bacterium]
MSEISFDKEGFLRHLDDWSPEVAALIAEREGIELTDAHWEIIELLREFYRRFEASPANRALVKFTGLELGPEKGRSIYLMA